MNLLSLPKGERTMILINIKKIKRNILIKEKHKLMNIMERVPNQNMRSLLVFMKLTNIQGLYQHLPQFKIILMIIK